MFNRTATMPTPGLTSPPESPLRRRVTDIDRRDASPQLMARGPRTRRGNSTTAACHSCLQLHESPPRSYCVAPAQPNALPKRPAAKPRPTGKQYVPALRARRSGARDQPKAQPRARQHTPGPRPQRPTAANVTPNLKSKDNGCSYQSSAT